MTTKELETVKALWFAYHQRTNCGETEQPYFDLEKMKMMNGKVAKEIITLIQSASLEARRAAECMSAAQDCTGFAGTTRDDVFIELQDAGAALLKAPGGIAGAQRALKAGKPVVGQASSVQARRGAQ